MSGASFGRMEQLAKIQFQVCDDLQADVIGHLASSLFRKSGAT
jgi:hypothetical protein